MSRYRLTTPRSPVASTRFFVNQRFVTERLVLINVLLQSGLFSQRRAFLQTFDDIWRTGESNVPSDGHALRLYVVLIFFVVDNFTNEDMCVFTFSVLHMFRHKKRVTGTRVGLSCYVIVIVICYSNIIVFYMKRGWLKLLLLFYCYFLFNREKTDRSWWLKCQQKTRTSRLAPDQLQPFFWKYFTNTTGMQIQLYNIQVG